MSAKNAQTILSNKCFSVILVVLVLVFSLAACKDTGVQVNNPAPTAQATDNGEANNGGNTDGEAPETQNRVKKVRYRTIPARMPNL